MHIVKKISLILIGLIALLVAGVMLFLLHPSFGKNPDGARLARISDSPNYKNGVFQNLTETPINTGNKSNIEIMYDFLMPKIRDLSPSKLLPTLKTDLHNLPKDKNVFIWMGHSSYFIQLDGKRFLIDPVLVKGAPLSFLNAMFEGSNVYSIDDIPAIDYLIITHDHWDHLDYDVVTAIKDRVDKVVTALGVGSHLEFWGYSENQIIELDWNEDEQLADQFKITALPARHFSGRTFTRNKTLWASFMLETPTKTIYIGGDSGYDAFYQDIAKRFPNIDLAIMENGQYNKDWAKIHILPEELPQIIKELNPKGVVTVHNSKFALARHSWKEPMDKIYAYARKENINLLTPMIGEVFDLNINENHFSKWWENYK
ncbi:MAG TPA: MBL fold metallo-hydrolase [Pasteurellaceae bacterium]|nr:MBL fold metallo-hydrolase [Pasteurellaceae bacterium]